MAKPPRPQWFLPEWRRYRGFSQEKLAERAGFGNKSYISLFESGQRRYSSEALEKLAEALGCAPWEILAVDPFKKDDPAPPGVDSIVETVRRIPAADREEFIDTTVAALERLRKRPVAKKTAKKKRA